MLMYPYFGKTQFLRRVIQLPIYLAKEIYNSGGARSHNKVTFRIASLQGGGTFGLAEYLAVSYINICGIVAPKLSTLTHSPLSLVFAEGPL